MLLASVIFSVCTLTVNASSPHGTVENKSHSISLLLCVPGVEPLLLPMAFGSASYNLQHGFVCLFFSCLLPGAHLLPSFSTLSWTPLPLQPEGRRKWNCVPGFQLRMCGKFGALCWRLEEKKQRWKQSHIHFNESQERAEAGQYIYQQQYPWQLFLLLIGTRWCPQCLLSLVSGNRLG